MGIEQACNKKARVDESSDVADDDALHDSVIYMDFNATTPLAPSVVDVITETMKSSWANPSSLYSAGVKAKHDIAQARSHVSRMLNADDTSEIVFTSGGTEANNHVIHNAINYFNKEHAKSNISDEKPHVISTVIEHDSILQPLRGLHKENLLEYTLIGVSKESGHVDPEEVLRRVKNNTVLISVMLANNETGALQPVKEIFSRVKQLKRKDPNRLRILCHTDAAQAIGKICVDVKHLQADYLTVVGHKFYGPRIGALWVHTQAPLHAWMHGGGQESGRRSGTENTCMIAGLGEAARLVDENLNEYAKQFEEIKSYLRSKLMETFKYEVLLNEMPCESLANTLNISFSLSVTGAQILHACTRLQASTGAACHSDNSVSQVLLAHGVSQAQAKSAVRLSFGRETSRLDVDVIVDDLRQAIERLRHFQTRIDTL